MRPVVLVATLLLLLGLTATPATAAANPIGGGSALFAPNYRCTVAFATVSSNLTGHLVSGPGCGPTGTQMLSGSNVPVGPVTGSSASGAVSVVRITNTSAWTLVPWIPVGGTQHRIRGAVETPIGGPVCLLDHSYGVRCGVITAKNQTVSFGGGVVIAGLTKTNICMSARSAIAFVSRDQAQGVPIGGSACSTTGVSYFLPIRPILSAYGLTLLSG